MSKSKPIDHGDRETLVRRRLRDVMGHATSIAINLNYSPGDGILSQHIQDSIFPATSYGARKRIGVPFEGGRYHAMPFGTVKTLHDHIPDGLSFPGLGPFLCWDLSSSVTS